jgi:hypothetical protein
MATNSKHKDAAVTIGAGTGRTDRTAHKVAEAGPDAKKGVVAISEHVRALRQQLQKNTEGVQMRSEVTGL